MTKLALVLVAHAGIPCDPPEPDGVLFEHVENDVWVGACTQEQADHFLRIPAYTLYGGTLVKVPEVKTPGVNTPGGALLATDEEVDAIKTHKDADTLATGLELTFLGKTVEEKKAELKAALNDARAKAIDVPAV